MLFISDIYKTMPNVFETTLQKEVYKTLKILNIPFERVRTDEVISMEDCIKINEKLDMKMVKTLFLCNRQKTDFYMFITVGDKSFKAKTFSSVLGVPRVSFAPSELMEKLLATSIGATTVFSTLYDKEQNIKIVIDKDVLNEEWYGCSDGTTTGYMKIKTKQIIHNFLPYTEHIPVIIEM